MKPAGAPAESARRNRTVVVVIAAIVIWSCAPCLVAHARSPATATGPRDISGVWWTKTYTPHLIPVGGGEVPLTDRGRKLYGQAQEAIKNLTFENTFAKAGLVPSWKDYADAIRRGPVTELHTQAEFAGKLDKTSPTAIVYGTSRKCLPPGVPRIMAAPYPFRIVQTRGQVTFLYEMNRVYRIVRIDAKHINTDYWDPSYTGEAVGRWEGDTLVIDTANFNEETFLDRSGLPHSDQLHVIERLRKVHGGTQLEALISIEDPAMYSRPWTTRLVYEWRPDVTVQGDWVCDEKHRDLAEVRGIHP